MIRIGFFVTAAISIAIAAVVARLVILQNQADTIVVRTLGIIDAIEDVKDAVLHVETDLRTFVMQGHQGDLAVFEHDVAVLSRGLPNLRAQESELSAWGGKVRALEDVLEQRIALLRDTAQVRQSRGFDAARVQIDTQEARSQELRVRSTLDLIEKDELAQLKNRRADRLVLVRELYISIAALAVMLALTLLTLYLLIQRRMGGYEAILASEQLFGLLAGSVQDYAILLLDEKGNVASWGVGAERIKGYTAKEIIGKHFSQFYRPEDQASGKPLRELGEATATGRLEDEGWRVRKDGSLFWAHVIITAIRDESGRLRGFGKVTQDLTERKAQDERLQAEVEERRKVEQQLRDLNQGLEDRVQERIAELGALNRALSTEVSDRKRAESRAFQAQQRVTGIIESAMDAIITADESQKIVLFNGAAQALFGYSQVEALGLPLTEFIPRRFRENHGDQMRSFGKESGVSRRMGGQRVVTALRRDGTEFPIDASISRLVMDGNLFFTVILRDVTEDISRENDLRESRAQLHEMAAIAQAAREQEKGRIARELHDELGQLLTSMKMDLGGFRAQLRTDEERRRVDVMDQLLNSMVAATRRISSDLRPMMLDDLGFLPAAEWLLENFSQRTGIDYAFDVEPRDIELPEAHATALYRILQESLTNVAKHAAASLVEVHLVGSDTGVVLTVRDNGAGFDSNAGRKPLSFGLVGLRERAFFLGGEVKVTTAPGQGTVIEACIPL